MKLFHRHALNAENLFQDLARMVMMRKMVRRKMIMMMRRMVMRMIIMMMMMISGTQCKGFSIIAPSDG